MIYGKSFLKTAMSWTISGEELLIKQSIVYLGTVWNDSDVATKNMTSK